MLFISTNVLGQTIPVTTFVQDTPFLLSSESYNDAMAAPADVRVEWVGTNGYVAKTPTLWTTVGALAVGVNISSTATKIPSGFYPIVETRVIVGYDNEKHLGVYPGLATVMSRTLHPIYWTVYY
ncbi:MAG: hypothetical protein LBP67_00160 [Bacteroidales bacterium]|nr:hypothetical protein [Bacteroidales bacterium]